MIGSVLGGRYELLQEGDEGPVFETYKALDRVANREVTVRAIRTGLDLETEFLGAVRVVMDKQLGVLSPSIERIYSWNRDEVPAFLVCEHTPGVTLEDRLRRLSSFSVSVALEIAIGICDGLLALHQSGLVHGDLSARNVICTPQDQVKLVMGGFWEAYGASERIGRAVYRTMAPSMAPELQTDSAPNVRTDIYALGVLIYQMLTGRLPFPGDTSTSIAAKQAAGDWVPVRQLNSSVPTALEELVKRCLSRTPSDRYRDVNELQQDLKSLSDALRFGRPLTWPIRPTVSQDVDEAPAVAPSLNVANPQTKRATDTGTAPGEPAPAKVKTKRVKDPDRAPACLTALVLLCTIAAFAAVGGWLFFNSQKPPLVDVPNIVGMSRTEAEAALKKAKLNMAVVRNEVSDTQPRGSVIKSDPNAGKKNARENSTVGVVLSAGGNVVELPDLRGRTMAEARSMMDALELTLEESPNRVRSKDLAEGMIVSMVPEQGKKVRRDTRVVVTLSAGDRRVSSNSMSQRYQYTAKFQLSTEFTEKVLVRVELTDEQRTRMVYEKEHAPGDNITVTAEGVGNEATFRVFYNGEFVAQQTKTASDATPRSR